MLLSFSSSKAQRAMSTSSSCSITLSVYTACARNLTSPRRFCTRARRFASRAKTTFGLPLVCSFRVLCPVGLLWYSDSESLSAYSFFDALLILAARETGTNFFLACFLLFGMVCLLRVFVRRGLRLFFSYWFCEPHNYLRLLSLGVFGVVEQSNLKCISNLQLLPLLVIKIMQTRFYART